MRGVGIAGAAASIALTAVIAFLQSATAGGGLDWQWAGPAARVVASLGSYAGYLPIAGAVAAGLTVTAIFAGVLSSGWRHGLPWLHGLVIVLAATVAVLALPLIAILVVVALEVAVIVLIGTMVVIGCFVILFGVFAG